MEPGGAKEEVLAAGRELVERGLVARTWGNVSCRIDEKHFAITPSGRHYGDLTADDIVVVETETLAYEGAVKPSSEKGIHAAAYLLKAETNFVIHTHQTCAAVLSVAGHSLINLSAEESEILGGPAPLAGYGLPGTKKLARNVEDALKRSGAAAVLMESHGALLTGRDRAQAFERAVLLEEICRRAMPGTIRGDGVLKGPHISSLRTAEGFVLTENGVSSPVAGGGNTPLEKLHGAIYRAHPSFGCIMHFNSDAVQGVMERTERMPALLDDFAQMAGRDIAVVRTEDLSGEAPGRIAGKLKGRNAVLVSGLGAVCCEKDEADCGAVMTLVEKNALTYVNAAQFGTPRALSFLDRVLMRFVYTVNYAKKK
ncbi:MAG: class II aldolase/adducin family protein [Treponema sp.]|jgi:L-fuculose-phosphate aldolase|nr:class II aldolase/adducin family protein [Treponema sp.]